MIGYYIHHVGHGHLHRALGIVAHLPYPVTAISSLPVHPEWPGPWLQLARDDAGGAPDDPTAGGVLHWVPRHDQGLQRRMAQLSDWIARHRPAALVVDLSVEVVVQARLLGVPVVTMTLPGERADRAHQLGYQLADAIVAPWPAEFGSIGPDLRPHAAKVSYTGAISRFAGRSTAWAESAAARPGMVGPGTVDSAAADEVWPAAAGRSRVLVLGGSGGPGLQPSIDLPGWSCRALGGADWADDPWPIIRRADVVVTHAGLGALADVATAGRPAIVLPQPRPHDEQVSTARALAAQDVAVVSFGPPAASDWPDLLDAARRHGGDSWSQWRAGAGAAGAAEVIRAVADVSMALSCR